MARFGGHGRRSWPAHCAAVVKHDDDGFVLLDALAATAVVALAGGAALAAMNGLLANQLDLVDRSLETTNVSSFVHTLVLDWPDTDGRAWTDGVFHYLATPAASSEPARGLARVQVQSFDAQDRLVSDFEIWVPE